MDTYDKAQLKRAVALKYEGQASKQNPKVLAKGHGDIADEILAIAQAHEILTHEDQVLVDILYNLELGQDIPENLYHVIAELIAFSYVLQGKFPDAWHNLHNKVDWES